jgi:hypothetical protein
MSYLTAALGAIEGAAGGFGENPDAVFTGAQAAEILREALKRGGGEDDAATCGALEGAAVSFDQVPDHQFTGKRVAMILRSAQVKIVEKLADGDDDA